MAVPIGDSTSSGIGLTGVKPITIHGCSMLVACLTFGRRQAVTCMSNYERIYSDKDISKLIQLLVKSNHTDDGKLERTRYLPWFSLFPKNSHVR
mgnify:CR=1 FL=1